MANAYSPHWFETFVGTLDPAVTLLEAEFLRRWLPDPPYRRVLDLCCGQGRHVRLLAERGYTVIGVDANSAALEVARRLSGHNGNIEYRLLDMRNIDALEETFDGVINMWQSFGYFDAATNRSILDQISRKLRPGGRFIIDLYNRDYFNQAPVSEHYQRNGQHIRGTRHLVADRMVVELNYGPDHPHDRFEWQLYTPREFCDLAETLGLVPRVVCAWWDETRSASAGDARMQIVLERTP